MVGDFKMGGDICLDMESGSGLVELGFCVWDGWWAVFTRRESIVVQ